MYWKSNAKTELGFYRINQKKNTRLSETELNINIAEAFAEMDDDDDECKDLLNETSIHHINKELPLIEDIWIDKLVDLSHDLIIKEIGNIPYNVLKNDIDNEYEKTNVDETQNKNVREGKGVLDYDINDLLDEFINENNNE